MPPRTHADLQPLDIGAPDDEAAAIVAAIRAYAARPVADTEDRIAVMRGLRHIQHAATQALLATFARAQFLERGHVALPDASDVTGYSISSIQYQAGIGRALLPDAERAEADATAERRREWNAGRRRRTTPAESA